MGLIKALNSSKRIEIREHGMFGEKMPELSKVDIQQIILGHDDLLVISFEDRSQIMHHFAQVGREFENRRGKIAPKKKALGWKIPYFMKITAPEWKCMSVIALRLDSFRLELEPFMTNSGGRNYLIPSPCHLMKMKHPMP